MRGIVRKFLCDKRTPWPDTIANPRFLKNPLAFPEYLGIRKGVGGKIVERGEPYTYMVSWGKCPYCPKEDKYGIPTSFRTVGTYITHGLAHHPTVKAFAKFSIGTSY